jgi:hypothetical protein
MILSRNQRKETHWRKNYNKKREGKKGRKNRMQQTKGRRQTKMEVEKPLLHYNTL